MTGPNRFKQIRQHQFFWPIVLGTVALVLYMASRSISLDDFDSYNFAMALTSFDLVGQTPQPPGFPVYVGLGRLFNFVFPNPILALTTLSALAGALSVGLITRLGQLLFDDDLPAILAGLLLMVMPVHWLTAAKVLSDSVGLAFTLGALVLVWQSRDNTRYFVAGAAVLGLGLGVRPQNSLPGLMLLGWYTVEYLRSGRWRPVLAALAAGAVACLLWFVPTAISVGGVSDYIALNSAVGEFVGRTDGLFAAGPVTGIILRARTLEFLHTFLMPTLGVDIYAPPRAGTVVEYVLLVFGLIGGLALSDWRKVVTWLLIGWLLVNVVPTFLFESLSRERRLVGSLAPLVLLTANGWLNGILWRRSRSLDWARVALSVGLVGWMSVEGWQGVHIITNEPAPHAEAALYVGNHYPAATTLIAAAGSYRSAQYHAPNHLLLYAYTWDHSSAQAAVDSGQYQAIAVLDRENFITEQIGDLTADWNYVPVEDLTFTRHPRAHILADEVRLQVLVPVDSLTADQLAPPDGGIDIGSADDGRFLGEGWYRTEDVAGTLARWAGVDVESTLRITLPELDTTLTIRALAFPEQGQSLTILVNGELLATVDLVRDWQEVTVTVPADLLTEDIDVITLAHGIAQSPYEASEGSSNDQRVLTVAYDWVRIDTTE